ncbi:MAG: lipopolysaccharide heptosyltransferase II [Chloroflexi bacterium]|nr:lipopolysaccharide heptosyltransferase II [Chloroflexota bacterium]
MTGQGTGGSHADWEAATRLLCVRLDSIGDVLMSTPAIRALRESVPGRRISLLTSPAGAEVASLVPEVDDTIVYDAPWMKATAPRADSGEEHRVALRLRSGRFDAAVIFTVFSQNPLPAAFLCYLADVPLRLAHCHENPYQLLTDWVPDPEPHSVLRHEVQRQLDLVATVGAVTFDNRLSLRVPNRAHEGAHRRAREAGIDLDRPWVVIHPGASAPSRRYPSESFAKAARRLSIAGFQVVLTGRGNERQQVAGIQERMGAPSFSLAGQLDVGELAALLALAPVLISNNTGPVHIAAAVGTPVVDLYALTNPQHAPWRVSSRVLSHDVPCKNCYQSICPEEHHHCLRLVSPEQVVDATLGLLAESVA